MSTADIEEHIRQSADKAIELRDKGEMDGTVIEQFLLLLNKHPGTKHCYFYSPAYFQPLHQAAASGRDKLYQTMLDVLSLNPAFKK